MDEFLRTARSIDDSIICSCLLPFRNLPKVEFPTEHLCTSRNFCSYSLVDDSLCSSLNTKIISSQELVILNKYLEESVADFPYPAEKELKPNKSAEGTDCASNVAAGEFIRYREVFEQTGDVCLLELICKKVLGGHFEFLFRDVRLRLP